MKRNDIVLIVIILLVAILFFCFYAREDGKIANVYYENNLILKINLKENKEYDVTGYNGNVHLVVENGKIKVEEENSPKHLCSKQGFISSSYETIVCLPNKIVIKIKSEDSVDTVIG